MNDPTISGAISDTITARFRIDAVTAYALAWDAVDALNIDEVPPHMGENEAHEWRRGFYLNHVADNYTRDTGPGTGCQSAAPVIFDAVADALDY